MATQICGFEYDYDEFECETKEELAVSVAYSMMCGIETYAQIIAQTLPFIDGADLAAVREVERAIGEIATSHKTAFLAVGHAVVESPTCTLELPDAAEVPDVFAAAVYSNSVIGQQRR